MSYSICYGSDQRRKAAKKRPYFGWIGAVLVIMICALAVGWSAPQQTEQFFKVLFPWTRSEVQTAFLELEEGIMDGQPFMEAVTAFCQDIIHNAEPMQ